MSAAMTLKSFVAAALLALSAAPSVAQSPAPAPSPGAEDPFLWLEEVDSPRALAWVEAQNAKTRSALEGDMRFEPFRKSALEIFTATDRIAMPSFRAGGVDNFWQDAVNPKGVWRRTSLDGFRAASPQWETLLDLQALGKAENVDWVWKGDTCFKPAEQLCLVRLSNGGKDAVELREFDTGAKRFVESGFRLPEGKQSAAWIDRDTLLVGREWTPGEVTNSGYAYVLKTLKRGQPLSAAKEVFRGKKTDVSVIPFPLYGDDGRLDAMLAMEGLNFFERSIFLLTDTGSVELPFPKKVSLQTYVDGQLVFTIEEDWAGHKAGALLSYDLAALKADAKAAKPQLILQPNERQAIEGVDSTATKLVVNLYEDVKGAIDLYDFADGRWTGRRIALPKDSSVRIVTTSGKDERLFATVQGFLDPTTLWLIDGSAGAADKVRALPARFDASKNVVEQFWATSSDGTRIPYFVVRPKTMKFDGSNATVMYGYGGFQVSKPPVYMPEDGKLWLERGGVYVIANIRGGGEFGPAWHQAVMREKRQLAFDDFAAVAQDLIARKITSPRRLGIYGRSNGGVLTSVAITQHPELYNASVIESPLIDMLRYHKLSAGASWVGEYGDPDVPGDYAFISKYSAYQQLKADGRYPKPYITTNAKDDRVHPGHARKFAARLQAATSSGDDQPVLLRVEPRAGHGVGKPVGKQADELADTWAFVAWQLGV